MKINRKYNFKKKFTPLVITLSICFFLSLGILNQLLKEHIESEERSRNYLRVMRLTEELKRSSDNLSRFALSYLASKDSFYKQCYFHELDLRKGTSPHPSRYRGGHWETSFHWEKSQLTPGEAKNESYSKRLENSGITQTQYERLRKTESLSDTLAVLETTLFARLENNLLKSNEAVNLLIGQRSLGNRLKFEIVKEIDDFFINENIAYLQDLDKIQRLHKSLILSLLFFIIVNILIFIRIIRTVTNNNARKLEVLKEEINERKKAQEKLQKSDLDHVNAQRIANFGSWKYDFETKRINWSNQIFKILNIDPNTQPPPALHAYRTEAQTTAPENDTLGNRYYFIDFVHPEDRAQIIELIERQKKEIFDTQLTYRLKLKTGVIKYIHSTIEITRDINSLYISGVLKDITEQKITDIRLKNSYDTLFSTNIQLLQKEKELQRINGELSKNKLRLENLIQTRTKELKYSKDLLNALFQELPLGVLLFNNDGQVIETNPITLKKLNMSKEQLKAVKLNDWIGLDKDMKPTPVENFPIARTLNERRAVVDQEIGLRMPDGSLIWFNCNTTVIADEYGGGGMMFYSDITEKKRIEEEIIKAKEQAEKAYRSKSQFLSNMSHEIRTPLHAILGFTEILNSKIEDEKLKHYVATIQSAGKNLHALINDVLDIAKIEAGMITLHPESVILTQIKNELYSLFKLKAAEKELKLSVNLGAQLPSAVLIDELRLRQILLNLVSNAIKFTSKGNVSVTIDAENLTTASCTLLLSVEDTGKGIEQDRLSEIFEDFTQENEGISQSYGGTGLGLSITSKLVKLFNGTISVTSEVGKGSTFRVSIPGIQRTKCEQTEHESDLPENAQDIKGMKILVVDDNLDNRNLMIEHLAEFQAIVSEASNGKEAVDMAKKQEIDLILMDIKMPVMDGYQAALLIHENKQTSQIPIIACTASAFTDTEHQILQSGFSGYLRKPIIKNTLIEEVLKYSRVVTIQEKCDEFILNNKTKELIKQQISPAWVSFKEKRARNSRNNLAKALTEIAVNLDNDYLKRIGEELTVAILDFDVSKTNMLLNKIEDLIENQ